MMRANGMEMMRQFERLSPLEEELSRFEVPRYSHREKLYEVNLSGRDQQRDLIAHVLHSGEVISRLEHKQKQLAVGSLSKNLPTVSSSFEFVSAIIGLLLGSTASAVFVFEGNYIGCMISLLVVAVIASLVGRIRHHKTC